MQLRHYPPAVIIHVPHCVEGQSLPALSIASVAEALPNHRLHFCFPIELVGKPVAEIAAIGVIPMITWETPSYGKHLYVPDKMGSQLPADTIDYPCKICRGTHGPELREVIRVRPAPEE